MKKLSEFDHIVTPQTWIDDALKIGEVQKEEVNVKKKRLRITGRISKVVMAAAVALVLFVASTFTYIAAVKNDFTMTDKEKEINEKPFVILLSGTDNNGDIEKASRSDVNILVAVNPKTKKLAVVNTDRDAYVHMKTSYGEGYDKLTHAGIDGMDTLSNTLSDLYHVSIDYYTKINFSTCVDFIDSLGGVSVYSDNDLTTGLSAGYQEYEFYQGYNECDGAMALAFCRERHALKDQSQRSKNQGYVLQAVLNKLMSKDVVYNMDEVLSNISNMMLTDMTRETMTALIKGQANSLADWSFTTYNVDSTTATKNGQVYGLQGMSVAILNEKSINEAKKQLEDVIQE